MKQQLIYSQTADAIKGYSESAKAKSETSDCVVRSIASASGMSYDTAHKFVAKVFNRKPRKGTYNFIPTMNQLAETGKKLNRKSIHPLGEKVSTYSYVLKNGKSKMTVGSFVKKYPKGSYMVSVKRHAFTIKDGVVIGNFQDSTKTKKIIEAAWKIGKIVTIK